jgi:hypothetical protein
MGANNSLVSGAFAKRWWTLQRFGFTPNKLWHRLFTRIDVKIFSVSIPKAGTHLLERALCLHTNLYRKFIPTVNSSNLRKWGELDALLAKLRQGQVIISHLHFTPDRLKAIKARAVRAIFLVRDPRDIVVSDAFYISTNTNHPQHKLFVSRNTFRDQLKLAVTGDSKNGFPSIGKTLEDFAGWFTSGCLIVRFEDLIGPQGGGDTEKQLSTVRAIYDYLGLEVDDDWIASASQQLFSNASPTFRKGTIRQWKQYFDSEIKQTFKRVAGRFVTQYGYETNDDW